MLDFACALYLGLRHPSAELGAWDALTLGRPAAAGEPPGALDLARGLAALCGCQAATLLPSTLHLFHDLFALLARVPSTLLVDSASYPIARSGAARSGAPLQVFGHADVAAAWRLARAARSQGRRPVLLADGYFPGADRAPPLAAYAALARETGGCLVLDDTQVLGLAGSGGGGSLRRLGLEGPHLVLGSSLSKAFGAPLAVLCGSAALVGAFEESSAARVHASPPSVAAVRAGLNALRINAARGDALRARVRQRVQQWRDGAARRGIATRGGAFPVQTLVLGGQDGAEVQRRLQRAAVKAVLQRDGARSALSFIITARHSAPQIEYALDALARCLRTETRRDHGSRI